MNWYPAKLIVAEFQRRLGPRLDPWLGPLLIRLPRLPRRTLVLGAVALLVFVIALAARSRLGPDDPAPTDHFVAFYCPTCGQSYRLSDREFERLWNTRALQHGPDGQSLRFKCRKCGKMTALRADQRRPERPADANEPG